MCKEETMYCRNNEQVVFPATPILQHHGPPPLETFSNLDDNHGLTKDVLHKRYKVKFLTIKINYGVDTQVSDCRMNY